ncbi:MAG: hypothetical protein CMJ25_10325 [Phycisphaerae bacterium]|nr:hypothetical protein [Phycisphaerae bacterium]
MQINIRNMINKDSKPSHRKELLRQYATIIFSKGTTVEQLEFLDNLQAKRYKHWNFNRINETIYKNDPLNIIDESIKNIKELNKQIF